MREIIISGASAMEIAVVEDGRLCEFILDDDADAAAETILLGRVDRVVTGMKAAFVDVGDERNGFLPLQEMSRSAVLPPLRSGMRVPVQIKKAAHGEKGAFLTRDITLCGMYVILMPMNRYVGVSARITDPDLREGLASLGRDIAGDRFGLVMRAAAAHATEAAVRDETHALLARWEDVSREAATAHAPSVLFRRRSRLEALLDDLRPAGVDRIVTSRPLPGDVAGEIPVVHREGDLMHVDGWRAQMEKALHRRVWLKSGANLVIDECEAMTVIDVNTAKFTGGRDASATILRTNAEAAEEIARQVRLRNVSGVILIDMIDMEAEEDRRRVLDALRDAFARDRVKTVIHGFTALGLIEMTRKKSDRTLREVWSQPCSACHASGRIPVKEDKHG